MINAHPGLPEFDYLKPGTYEEASQFLLEKGKEAQIFMGGTDIIVRMRDGVRKEKFLVDVKNLDGMKDIHFDKEKGLSIGAASNMNNVVSALTVQKYYPLLAEAAHSVASYQLRSRATIVGNICNASPAGDTTGACLVYDGILKVHHLDDIRDVALNDFFLGPGKTALKPGDIVSAIYFPIPNEKHVGRYLKLGRNAIGDLAIVGVTVLGQPDYTAFSGFRFKIALASVAPIPLRASEAEHILSQNTITEETIEEAALAAMAAAKPIDDVRGSAVYRKQMVRNLVRKGLKDVWQQLSGN